MDNYHWNQSTDFASLYVTKGKKKGISAEFLEV